MRTIVAALACTACMLLIVGGASAAQIYPDLTGDARGGAEIRSVAFDNDASGTIRLRVTLGSPLAAAHTLALLFDVDKRATTGAVAGVEAVVTTSPARPSVGVTSWDGSRLAPARPLTLRIGARGNVIEISIHRRELANTRGFRFRVLTMDASGAESDSVPQKGFATYDLWACSNGVDDDRDGRVDFPRDRGCTSAKDDVEAGSVRRRSRGRR